MTFHKFESALQFLKLQTHSQLTVPKISHAQTPLTESAPEASHSLKTLTNSVLKTTLNSPKKLSTSALISQSIKSPLLPKFTRSIA